MRNCAIIHPLHLELETAWRNMNRSPPSSPAWYYINRTFLLWLDTD